MDQPIVRGLNDKLYDRRKAAALELEKVVAHADTPKITQIINQLCQMFTSTTSPLHTRNGGLIGLAATAIALSQDFSKWLGIVIPRVLACFRDPESRVRYYACESLYNIAKVCKGEILVHFNGIFDALSKLSADSEASVKNGAELLDRLLKDIVAETALNYISRYPENVDKTFGDWEAESWFENRKAERRQKAMARGEVDKGMSHPLETSPVMGGLDLPAPNKGGNRGSMPLDGDKEDTGKDSIARDPSPHSISRSAREQSASHQRILSAQTAGPRDHLGVGTAGPSGSTSSSPAPHQTLHHHGHLHNRNEGNNSISSTPARQETREPKPRVAFSLAKFVPLLSERIYVISPFTRSHLISWINILDSIPDLELVSYLPEFLDGLLKYLSDPNPDVKIATENVLGDFLREIKHIARVQARLTYNNGGESVPPTGRSTGYGHGRRVSDVHASSGGPVTGYSLRRRGSKLTMNTDTSELDSTYGGTGTTGGDGDREITSPDVPQLDDLQEEEDEEGHGRSRRHRYGHDMDGEIGNNSMMTSQDAEDDEDEDDLEDHGAWIPGQGVFVDYAAIMDIMIQHLSYPDEQIQSISLKWIESFLTFVQDVMVPFTPRLIAAILPNLAHHVPYIQSVANETNQLLYRVIQALPTPQISVAGGSQLGSTATTTAGTAPTASLPVSQTGSATNLAPSASAPNSLSVSPANVRRDTAPAELIPEGHLRRKSLDLGSPPIKTSDSQPNIPNLGSTLKPKSIAVNPVPGEAQTPVTFEFPNKPGGEPPSSIAIPVSNPGMSVQSQLQQQKTDAIPTASTDEDPFDARETVNQLTLQFLSEHEETRIAALEWLSMLHQKSPKKILARDDGTFPALLKTLSDPSEEVVKHDLQLLAQISANSDDGYFSSFLVNLLELFSTDRRLLETRGSLIIRQLCLNLNTERIFRNLAEILEKNDDLEFASLMVVKLNMILITSPELAEFRKRLKNIESKDGQMLFTSIYKSWCHNAVAVFALCLLAQAYEHASTLLQTFAELEMTVSLLVQIDKLVMLIESPVFTSLRLQLLEPEKYPYLFKCLYGLLMLLPQSSAFVSLRNRLNAVSSMGFLHIPKPAYTASVAATRSKISTRDEIKWDELLRHFRITQNRHEKARRLEQANEGASHGHSASSIHFGSHSITNSPSGNAAVNSQARRRHVPGSRKDSGHGSINSVTKANSTLSPLNPRRGGPGSTTNSTMSTTGQMTALSLGAPFASSIQPGMTSSGPMIVNGPKSPTGTSRRILPGLRRN